MFADINPTELLVSLARYATPEVITVFGALLTAWVGWKVAAKSFGLIGAFAQKCSFLGLTAAVLFVAGLGTTGVGTGEVVARITDSPSREKEVGISDEKLIQMAEKCNDKEMAKVILAYAQLRDAKNKGKGTGADAERLAGLVERVTPENKEAVVALINYMKAKEERESGQPTALDARQQLVSTTLLTTGIESPEQPKAQTKWFAPFSRTDSVTGERNSMISLQAAIGMICAGIACSVLSVCLYNRRQQPATR